MTTRRPIAGWWNALVAAGLALACAGCATIPTTAVTLSEELYQYQRQQVEHIGDLNAAFERVLVAESKRQVAPLVALELRVQTELHSLRGMLAVEADPSAPVEAQWADDPLVVGFRAKLVAVDARQAAWGPWVELARSYEALLAQASSGGALFTHAALQNPASVPTVVTQGLLAPAAAGTPWPAGLQRNTLQSDWQGYQSDRDDEAAKDVGESVDALIVAILKASGVEAYDRDRSKLRAEINTGVGERQDLLAAIQNERLGLDARLTELRALTRRDLDAMQSNAGEIERGLDALSTGLRRGNEAVYRPKNDIVSGLKSLAGNLGQLDVIDGEKVDRFSQKVDELSKKYDGLVSRFVSPGA